MVCPCDVLEKRASMNKKSGLFIFVAFLLIVLIFSFLRVDASNLAQDKQDIQSAIEKFYSILSEVASTYDVEKFADILLDTGDCQPEDETRKFIEQTMGKNAAMNAGYLTAMQAKYIARGNAYALLETAQEKAKSENRELTQEEKKQILDANGGVFPPVSVKSSTNSAFSSTPTTKKINIVNVEIKGDWGKVTYDTSQALQEAILIRKNGFWFVTCIKPIQVHY